MRRMNVRPALSALALGLFVASVACLVGAQDDAKSGTADKLREAQRLLLTGNYAETIEQFDKARASEPIQAAIGLSRSLAATGKGTKAEEALRDALKAKPDAPAPQRATLHAELAVLLFERGAAKEADEAVAAALKLDKDALPAWWVRAELFRTAGKLKEALAAYEWFVDYYNERQDDLKDPEAFRWIGRAAAQYARWTRNNEQFSFLVNTLYPDALKLDDNYWPAKYEAGLLFLEKYNQADATRKFNEALAINPNAAEVLAAQAQLALQNFRLEEAKRLVERALEINPASAEAHRLKADFFVQNFQEHLAAEPLEAARKLSPTAEETLGRIAALNIIQHGLPKDLAGSDVGKLIAEVNARNPKAGVFYFTLADKLADRQKFPVAERFFQEAIRRMPELVSPRSELGLMYMRLGKEVEAKKLLEESHDADPFNVRVLNTLKVLDVLATYATLETEHFILKFDRGQDELLARYAAKYLEEEVYPALCKQFGFKPEGKTLIEIFNKAQNTSGHSWFSARMVGLPYIGTVGACAGKMIGMASPASVDQPFNWARVLKHEFVHVLNLQQTNFNVPHWFTESLAVLSEETPRPETWDRLLAARVPKGDVFNLDNINFGFIRPGSSDDWHMAYCQAELYAQYLLKTHGPDALAKMLAAYGDNLNTTAALKRCFGVEQAEFEQGYLAFLKAEAAGLSLGPAAEPEMEFADLQAAVEKDPANLDLKAKLALAHLDQKEFPAARRLAEAVLKAKPKHALAGYVMARVRLVIGENDEALRLLEGALDEKSPDERVLTLLANLMLKKGDTAAAEKLFELGQRTFKGDSKWAKALAGLYLKSGDVEKLAAVLARLADKDFDHLLYRKKLAQLALEKKDFAKAIDWANQAVQINVIDVEVHRTLAAALEGAGRAKDTILEYETLIRLAPDDLGNHLALAKAFHKTRQPDKARDVLTRLLELDAEFPGAKELLEQLRP